MRDKHDEGHHVDGLTITLILSVLFVLVNVVLTVNGMSPFEILFRN